MPNWRQSYVNMPNFKSNSITYLVSKTQLARFYYRKETNIGTGETKQNLVKVRVLVPISYNYLLSGFLRHPRKWKGIVLNTTRVTANYFPITYDANP